MSETWRATDSYDFTNMLFDGVPFAEVLRAAAYRAQARAEAAAEYEAAEKKPDAPTARPKR